MDDYLPIESWTSVSGGKSSAYMALNFPTDRYIFSCVLTSDPECVIRDKSLRRYCKSKLPWFDWDNGGSREVDLTLSNLRRLEQMLGKEIEWVSALFTFDEVIAGTVNPAEAKTHGARATPNSPMLPNSRMRFCTTTMKVLPVTWHVLLNSQYDYRERPVLMNIGYRWDEARRVEDWKCQRVKLPLRCDIEGRFRGKHRHTEVDYRIVEFPMYNNRVDQLDVARFWADQGWTWPRVSNCDGCFFHQAHEQLLQAQRYPERMAWWEKQEEKIGATFGNAPRREILKKAEEDSKATQLTLGLDSQDFMCLCSD